MADYTRALLSLAAVSLVCVLLFPDGAKKNKRAFELALAILSLAILARPLSALREFSFSLHLPGAEEVGDLIAGAEGETMERLAEAVGEGIEADIITRFSLPDASVRAEVTLAVKEGEMTVKTLLIRLGHGAIYADHIAIGEYAKKTYTQNCEVRMDGG